VIGWLIPDSGASIGAKSGRNTDGSDIRPAGKDGMKTREEGKGFLNLLCEIHDLTNCHDNGHLYSLPQRLTANGGVDSVGPDPGI
jgi:hypothetical protein